MGCEQSTPVSRNDEASTNYRDQLKGVGQTERQISKMQRAAMNNAAPQAVKSAPKLDEQGFLLPEEVAKRTFSSISNRETVAGTISNLTHIQVSFLATLKTAMAPMCHDCD